MHAQTDSPRRRNRPQTTVWRIFRSWGGAKPFVGIVDAPSKELAISKAIAEFEISDPDHQKHLIAEPRD